MRQPPREISSDEAFSRSLAGFSRQLAERFGNEPGTAGEIPPGSGPAAANDQPAEHPHPQETPRDGRNRALATLRPPEDRYSYLDGPPSRIHPLMLVLAFVLGVAVAAGALYFATGGKIPLSFAALSPPETVAEVATPTPATIAAAPAPAPAPASATVPAPALPDPVAPRPAIVAGPPPTSAAATPPAEAVAVATAQPDPAAPADKSPLKQDELLELQTILKSFGFDPGPLDGYWGPLTSTAVRRFEESRGLQPMGNVDRDTLMLLRQSQPTAAARPQAAKPASP